MPARCCYTVMHHGVAGGALSPVELDLYKLRYDEQSTPNPLYCPIATCSTFIPPRLIDSGKTTVECTICTTCICIKCRGTVNDEHACGSEDTAITKIKALNYKTCPKCGTGVMKMYGKDPSKYTSLLSSLRCFSFPFQRDMSRKATAESSKQRWTLDHRF